MSFSKEWLLQRYSFDAQARNSKVQKSLERHLHLAKELNVVDVGSGLGNNVRYYSPLLSMKQNWQLIDSDTKLCSDSLLYLKQWAQENHWQPGLKDSLTFLMAEKKISVDCTPGSLLELENIIALKNIDLITANAVFDLFSQNQFKQFLQTVGKYHIPILTTLNYTSMCFAPQNQEDIKYIALYEQHMQRKQSFGRAMGAQCAKYMLSILQENNYHIKQGTSTWKISYSDTAMVDFLLGFMKEAIAQLLKNNKQKLLLYKWIDNKYQIENLQIFVDHLDLFAWQENYE